MRKLKINQKRMFKHAVYTSIGLGIVTAIAVVFSEGIATFFGCLIGVPLATIIPLIIILFFWEIIRNFIEFEEDNKPETKKNNRNKKSFPSTTLKNRRFLNYILDSIIFLGIFLGIMFILGVWLAIILGQEDAVNILNSFNNPIVDTCITLLAYFAYYLFFESVFLKTPAKFITHTKTININIKDAPTFKQILIRSLCRFIPFDAFSFLGKEIIGWHDSISGTTVIFDKPENSKDWLDNPFLFWLFTSICFIAVIYIRFYINTQ
jgi:uncharacterized RDD family membrane protein YckC